MAITLTPQEVVDEGQFRNEYFPNCESDAGMLALVSRWITSANASVKRQVGTHWDTTDADIAQELRDCILHLVLARCWQAIKSVMDTYDAEALPPEHVDPQSAADSRDFHLGEAKAILVRYDATPGTQSYAGCFVSSSPDETLTGPLGLDY